MATILDDQDLAEVKITIDRTNREYTLDIEQPVKADLLYAVIKDIMKGIEDGSFFEKEGVEITKSDKENEFH